MPMTSPGTSRPIAPLEYTLTSTLPSGSSTNPVDWRYTGSSLMKAPVVARDGVGVGAVADRKPQPALGDQVLGGGFVIDRQRGHLDADVGEVGPESAGMR